MPAPNPHFWRNKRVLVTGHTGFKGSWAALWLKELGATVTGLALSPDGEESHFDIAGVSEGITSIVADIRDAHSLRQHVREARPEIVLHMAAQALVRPSYADPVTTWQTNVLGTLNLLEAVKDTGSKTQILIVTSDKVYRNDETGHAFVEDDPLGGHDPYSASKAACEILTASWRDSVARDVGILVTSARAGNVIGGGDFAGDRLVPDIWRAIHDGKTPQIRNPQATRPWQHVLDCINGYLLYIEASANRPDVPLALNFGPDTTVSRSVSEIADDLLAAIRPGEGWDQAADAGPREMSVLAIDSGLARRALGWRDYLAGDALSRWTADWYRAYAAGSNMRTVSLGQIAAFMNGARKN